MQHNSAQLRAISHREGPMLVLAGPGSGKTTVITKRTCSLLQDGISPSSLLVVTFTRAAANEMKSRFLKLIGQETSEVTFGTFHGVFYGILRHTFHITGQNILSEEEKNKIMKELLKAFKVAEDGVQDLPSEIGREISMMKSERIQPKNYYSSSMPDEDFRKLFSAYESWKQEHRKLDFDDIMSKCYELFTKRKDILALWQKKFKYIMVDEFQDISPLQYDILRMLALPENNLFIVGDDDQSIYRFRGASPEIMLHFPKDYKDAKKVVLDYNYRSTPQIVNCAGRLIKKNTKRFRKDIKPVRESGNSVEFRVFKNSSEETKTIAEKIRKQISEGRKAEEIAILCRTNNMLRPIVEQLICHMIPFRLSDMIPCVYDHWIAKDILAYLSLADGKLERKHFLQIANKPNRYLSRDAFYENRLSFDNLYFYYEDKEWMCDRLEKLETDLKVLKRLSPYGAVQYIRNAIGYEEYLREYALKSKMDSKELIEILDELAESAKACKSVEDWISHMDDLRSEIARQHQKKAEGVIVSTLHAAKGMEYDTVYILDVNEGVIPYKKAVLDAEIEEERRMLYVGMTRARKELYLSAVKERYDKAAEISHFLHDVINES